MNNITPEQLAAIGQGATPLQIITLVLLGVIALGVVIGIVKWIIDIKLGTLPTEIGGIRKSLESIKTDIARMEGKLWDKEDLQREMKAAIADHIEKCPYYHKDRK